MRHLPKICLMVVLPFLVANNAVAAQPDELEGRIVSVDPNNLRFVLHVNNDELINFSMDEDAAVLINDVEVSLHELLPDDLVTVTFRQDGDHWYAIQVYCVRR